MTSKKKLCDALLDETNDIVLVVDGYFRICESSRIAQALLGLKPQGQRGPSLSALLSEKDDGSLLEALASLRKTDKEACVESSLRSQDGGYLKVRLTLRALPEGGKPSSREKNRILLVGGRHDSMSGDGDSGRFGPLVARVLRGCADPVFVLDMARLTILKCNERAIAAFGWKRDELVGAPFDMLSEGGTFTDDFLNASQFAYATSGVFQSRLRLKRKDGGFLACVCTNIALFGESGLIENILCILRDRSDEERRKAELGQLVAEAAAISSRLESAASRYLGSTSRPRLSERGLSRRHIEIIDRVASGLTTKAIARELRIAEATVKSHLTVIYRKLEVRSRTELLRYIHDNDYKID
jgi:PAS domain-containing protein/DNA-binding CsgD family transcriptional regulator